MKNKKGVAISSVIYMILITFILLVISVVILIVMRNASLTKLKNEVREELGYDSGYYSVDIFYYTGDYQEFVVPKTGNYQLEAWGASGGYPSSVSISNNSPGHGAYTSGSIYLTEGEIIYIYVGGEGESLQQTTNIGGYNGGGYSGNNSSTYSYGGGGSTDFRLINGEWNDSDSLASRIMVSGAGGGSILGTANHTQGGSGGGLTGYNGTSLFNVVEPTGGTQITFGTGHTDLLQGSFGASSFSHATGWGGGGGSGYYGGANGYGKGGAGGSSYISGHTGSVAITSISDLTPKSGCVTGTTNNACSIHYSNISFTDTVMIDGDGYSWSNVKGVTTKMPNPFGGYYDINEGHIGNGIAKITYVNADVYVEDTLNGGEVLLGDGMVPVIIDDTGVISVADLSDEWYNYARSEWANAVVVNDSVYRNAIPGTVIPIENIVQMYVYIPRYEYEVFSFSETEVVDINFTSVDVINKIDLTTPLIEAKGLTITHPAFYYTESDGTVVDLPGIWFSKFEVGNEFKVIPTISRNTTLNVSSLYSGIANLNNKNGLNNTSDVHMMKNSEWGAVAYLSQSIYGLCESLNSCSLKVENNNFNPVIAGCGADDIIVNGECTEENQWNSSNGIKASTTNNITGIYDMAAGTWEYTMAVSMNSDGSINFGSSGFTSLDMETKYYDKYLIGSNSQQSHHAYLGDAMEEVIVSGNSTINNDAIYYFFNTTSSWFNRGGWVNNNAGAGIFSSAAGSGGNGNTSRAVVWTY